MSTNLPNTLPITVVGTISGTAAEGTPTSISSLANIQHVVIVNEDPLEVNLVGNGILTAVTGTFSQSLTVSGLPVVTTDQVGLLNVVEDLTPQLGGNLDALGKDISGVNEFTAVTGTFTTGLTIGTGSTDLYPNEIRTNALTVSGSLTVSGVPVVTTGQAGLLNIVEDPTPQLGGNLDAQNNDISGVNELTAVTGTFTSGLTIGAGSTDIYPNEIRTNSLTASGSLIAGNFAGKNIIINGNFDVWQRGTSFNQLANNTCSADRWKAGVVGTGKIDHDQSSDVPDGLSTYSLKLSVDTTHAVLDGGSVYTLKQKVEGTNVRGLGFGGAQAQTVTLSFLVKSSLTGTYCFTVMNGGANRSYTSEYTINNANTWERKTITIPGDTAGTWLKTDGIGLRLLWALAVGTSWHAAADVWNAAQDYATSNQVNWMADSNTFFISRVQLEIGNEATEFEYRPYPQELALCQRYFQRTGYGATGQAGGPSGVGAGGSLPVTLRTTPTITLNTTTASIRHAGGTQVASSGGLDNERANINGWSMILNGFSGLTLGNHISLITDAIDLDAEL